MRSVTVAVAVLGALLALPGTASAATFTVTKTADTNVACAPANCSLREAVNAANAAAGDDRIVLPAGTYVLTGAAGEDAGASGDLDVTDSSDTTAIVGAGAAVTTIHGNDADRIFDVLSFAQLEVHGVRLRDGNAIGGAIQNADSDVTVRDVVFESNRSPDDGGAIFSFGANRPRVVIEDSVFTGNTATGDAGAIYNDGDSRLVVTGSRFVQNLAGARGGVLFTEEESSASIDSTLVDGNGAVDEAGGIGVQNDAALTLTRSRITRNSTTLEEGGGLWIQNSSAVTIEGSTVAGNRSLGDDDGNDGGGGLWIQNDANVRITNSTVSGNTAARLGGGLYVRNFVYLTLVNSTIGGNTAGQNGGALYAEGQPVNRIENSTMAGNRAAAGGGIYDGTTGAGEPFRLQNTIVAANTAGSARNDCSGLAGGVFTSRGNNLDSTGTCDLGAAGDRRNVNARLGPLASNGGPTQTFALLAGSPAIDAGSGDCPGFDQRGVARPQGARCDIGAFEAPPRAVGPAPPRPPGPPPPDRTRPALNTLSLRPATFRAAPRGASTAGRRPVGTRVRYRLSERATVRFTVARATTGRRVGRRCVRRTRRNAGRRRCRRYVAVRGSFTHVGAAGQNSFRFTGRVRGRRLRPARYRLTAVATDAARNRSTAARRNFRIVRR